MAIADIHINCDVPD